MSDPQGPYRPESPPSRQPIGTHGVGQAPVPYPGLVPQPGSPHSEHSFTPSVAPSGSGGLGVASLVVGIVALLGSVVLVGGLLGLVGAVLGVVALVRGAVGRLPAVIGTVLSGLAMLISLVVLVVLIVAPSGPQVESVSRVPSADAPAATPGVSPSATPTAESAVPPVVPPPSPTNAAFGDRITYDDGLSVTVSGPEPYAVGDYAFGADQAANVVFTIVVENGTGKNYEPFLYSSVSSAGAEASQIYGDDVEMTGPSTTIPPGQSTTYREAYSLADAGAIVFDLRVGSSWRNAVFQL